jgi:hypothetical protein
LSEIEIGVIQAQGAVTQFEATQNVRLVEEHAIAGLGRILPTWIDAFRTALPHQRKFLLNQVIDRVTVFDESMEVAVNVKIKELLTSSTATETETAAASERSITRPVLTVHQRNHRGTNTHEDAQSMDRLEPYFQFQLAQNFTNERINRDSLANWQRVRALEAEAGRPFGEIVRELRLGCEPREIPGHLGVSRHFLYEHYGWAMDKIAYVEQLYGLSLGEAVALRRSRGATMGGLAAEWRLAISTLYNALKGSSGG